MALKGRQLRDLAVGAAMLFLALLIIAKLENNQAIRFSGPFVVIDGDTLADNGRRLRLRGLDAPELGQMCTRADGAYDCGLAARAGLVSLIEAHAVQCFGPEDAEDRYGRRLVTCRSGEVDLGHKLVGAGLAVADGDYHMAERQATADRLGLWGGTFERPEDWRRRRLLETREPGGWFQTFLLEPLIGWMGRGDMP
ncbi:thermonuclease family protein [Rhizobium sp. AG855]|uniref:thermonuclease family protein n=1 Tax=Rhizobium sp. AG855 TaxID=2183898 RepID=UPI000FF0531D|nr:thermonuclease family protein [Rhizobium sp. AG855]RKE84418.1 endonuclease YncB(thermonuclease family) [Rhizobium sp. AG855]